MEIILTKNNKTNKITTTRAREEIILTLYLPILTQYLPELLTLYLPYSTYYVDSYTTII